MSATDELMKLIGGNDEQQDVNHWLDTGLPTLNHIISGRYDGGVPYGRIGEWYGPSSSGKTLLSTLVMLRAQQAGGVAMFLDHERSFSVRLAKRLGLVDTPPHWVFKQPKTWEASNTMALKAAQLIRQREMIDPSAPIVVVLDSVASCIPQSVYEKGIDEYTMNDTTALARVASTTLKAVKDMVAEFNVAMIYLNQIRTKPGVMFGDPTTTPGGGAFEFYADYRLALGRAKIKDGSEVIGQQVTAKTSKNKLTRPFRAAKWRFMFRDDGSGYIDFIGTMIDAAVELGLLAKPTQQKIQWLDGKAYPRKTLIEKVEREGEFEALRALFVDPEGVTEGSA